MGSSQFPPIPLVGRDLAKGVGRGVSIAGTPFRSLRIGHVHWMFPPPFAPQMGFAVPGIDPLLPGKRP